MTDDHGRQDEAPTRTRRDLLTAGAGAIGVLAAEALTNTPVANAADGDPVLAGKTTESSNPTFLNNTNFGPSLVLEPTDGAALKA